MTGPHQADPGSEVESRIGSASLLLHDVVWVSDHVFDLDSDDPLESVPYRVLDRLHKKGLVRYVPCAGQPATGPLREELERQAADLVSGLVDEEEAPQVDRQEVQRALLERTAPEVLVATGEWNEFLGNVLPQRSMHRIARFGPIPSLAGYSVLRQPPRQTIAE